MRIRELLENKQFDDLEFVKKDGDKEEIDYDLVEDLVYFMNNDDEMYRRHVYPAISKCLGDLKTNRKTSPSVFEKAVQECYKNYIQKFPIRDLKDSLEPKLFKEACKKLHEETCSHYEEGKYKD